MTTPEIKDNTSIDSRLKAIREDFPILAESIHGKPLVYFDNAATAQKPRLVIDAVSQFYLHSNSNVHRGVHSLSQRATEVYEEAREKVRSYLNARLTEEIIFTRGTTDSLNLAAHSLAQLLHEGDEVLSTQMEHHSNFVPWQMLAHAKGAVFKIAGISDQGELSMEELKTLITDRTKILAITHASNTLGTINDIKAICKLAHEKNVIVIVDGAQYIPHGKVDVQDLDCDLYAFSGHKLFGPTGVGILYGKKEILDKMPPYQFGGGMITEVTLQNTTFSNSPQVFEAGTPNIAGAHGLSKAIDYLNGIGHDFIHKHECDLLEYATKRMREIPGMKIFGNSTNKVPLVTFLVNDIHPFDLGTVLDQMGIAVRTGHHCTQPIMVRFGIPGAVRASFAFYNTMDEIDRFIEALNKAVKILS
jgi:cysteine desulfurase/selenocysteine lyase